MEIDELEIVRLELKYCETCGGLWLRPGGSSQVECAACVARFKRTFEQVGKSHRARLPRFRNLDLDSVADDVPEWLPAPAGWGRA
jgi:Zn-finger nucleic acid-binding protein